MKLALRWLAALIISGGNKSGGGSHKLFVLILRTKVSIRRTRPSSRRVDRRLLLQLQLGFELELEAELGRNEAAENVRQPIESIPRANR